MTRKPMIDKDRLAAFADGELSPEEAAAVVMHLADHPEDQAWVDEVMAANVALARAFSAPMAEPVPDRFRALILPEAEPAATVVAFRPRRAMPQVWAGAAVALAAALAVMAFLPEPEAGLRVGPVAAGSPLEAALMAQAFAEAPFVAATEICSEHWRWLLLNTKGETPAGYFPTERCDALVQQLDRDTRPVWLFCHHQPLPIGASIDQHGLQQPELLLSTLARFPQVKGLAHGHCHYAYQTQHPAGFWIVGCPATSVQFTLSDEWQTEDLGPQGCVWTFAADGEATWEFIRL